MPNVTALENLSELPFAIFSLKTFTVSNGPSGWGPYLVQFWTILRCFFQFSIYFKEVFIYIKWVFTAPQGNSLFNKPTGQAGGLVSSFFSLVLQSIGKIREVLLFSSFFAFPKQKLIFFRDEAVIYNTCKEKASTWSFDITLLSKGKVGMEIRYPYSKERRKV